jgi:hypothetical protein
MDGIDPISSRLVSMKSNHESNWENIFKLGICTRMRDLSDIENAFDRKAFDDHNLNFRGNSL